MPAPKIGSNAGIMANRGTLDATLGNKVTALKRALREITDLKHLIDQYTDTELVALNYTNGTNGTADEVGYIRSALADAEELDKIFNGTVTARTLPFNFDGAMKYVAALV
jgi:hypothetical protein